MVNEKSSDKVNSSNSNKIIANNNCDKNNIAADNMQSAVTAESSGDVCAAGNETGARRKTLPAAEDGGREREPEGSADITPPFSESSNSNSTPPYIRYVDT